MCAFMCLRLLEMDSVVVDIKLSGIAASFYYHFLSPTVCEETYCIVKFMTRE